MNTLLQKTFQNKYSSSVFKEFTAKLFQKSSGDFMSQKIFPENFDEKLQDSQLLLSFETDDKKKIDVLSIELKKKSNVENARSYQRGLIEKYIKNRIDSGSWVDGVLVSFWNAKEGSWRLSFVKMELKDGKKKFTPPKRFSFLIGESESTHTAEKQFLTIFEQEKTPLFAQLEEVFSVEKVTNEFFDLYKKHFLSLNEQFLNNEVFQTEVVEKQGVKNADFVKKLMGQVVFLYFLQKKGWMGVKKDEKWGSGDKHFMRNILSECLGGEGVEKERGGKNFFNDYLEHLFYDTLNNKDRGGASVTGDYSWTEYFKCRIPYLNGGLFEPDYKWKSTFIDIPNESFKNLFDTFDRFNFTVYEADSLETDVAVDPEMLGKVFENLLEIDERKGKGAFYTPREIVHYMCQESLINYLTNASGYEEERVRKLMDRKDEITAKSDAERNAIKNSVELKEMADTIDILLQKVTVCDPAVGSGAFPMGMLKEIVSLRFFLNRIFLSTPLTEYDIKKQTLEHCIYGVDIEKGAIEICRLRFWLSMVVEHDIEEVEPLPNLDYKLMQGNSLLEDLVIGESVIKLNIGNQNKGDKRTKEMKALLSEEEQSALFSMESSSEIVDKLEKLHTEFFATTEPAQKKIMKLNIDKYENSLIQTACRDEISGLREVSRNERGKGVEVKAKKAEEQIMTIEKTLEKWEKDKLRPFFPWKLHFGEIFKNGGFDIVIGNPPYIKEYTAKNAFDGLRSSPYYMGKMDLWYFFGCIGLDILKNKGVQSFIAPNNWVSNFGAKKIREKILKDSLIKEFIDFGNYKVFDTAGIQTMVYLLEKNKKNDNYKINYSRLNIDNPTDLELSYFLNSTSEIEKQEYENFIFNFEKEIFIDKNIQFLNPEINKITEKIRNGDIFYLTNKEVANGIHPHFDFIGKKQLENLSNEFKKGDGVFALSKKEKQKLNLQENEKQLVKPYFMNDKFFKYGTNPKNNFSLIYTDSRFKNILEIKKYPNIKKHLDRFKEIITSDNKPYGLHRARNENFFKGEKIVVARKCIEPTFSYNDFDCYVSATFYVIKTDKINMKFLTGLLNSILIKFWLKYKGKMQGSNYQIDKEPILNIPISQISEIQQKPFIEKVDQILEITSGENYDPKNIPEQQKIMEKEIDEMVFDLYGLSEEERRVVLGG